MPLESNKIPGIATLADQKKKYSISSWINMNNLNAFLVFMLFLFFTLFQFYWKMSHRVHPSNTCFSICCWVGLHRSLIWNSSQFHVSFLSIAMLIFPVSFLYHLMSYNKARIVDFIVKNGCSVYKIRLTSSATVF